MLVDHSRFGSASTPWMKKCSHAKVRVYWWKSEKVCLHLEDDWGMKCGIEIALKARMSWRRMEANVCERAMYRMATATKFGTRHCHARERNS